MVFKMHFKTIAAPFNMTYNGTPSIETSILSHGKYSLPKLPSKDAASPSSI
jgi:hypothetical protein